MSPSSYTVLRPRTFDAESLFTETFALDVLMGLSAQKKSLSSKYFYDDAGSALFSRLMNLPEYYLTGCEFEIFERHKGDISRMLPRKPFSLVELGAGDGRKTTVLLREFLKRGKRFEFVPIDISEAAVKGLTSAVREDFPGLRTRGIVSDYFDAFKWLNRGRPRPRVVLFLGSTIGNFSGPRARVFLRTLWNALNPGDLVLIGFDLKKDINVLRKAYNDSKGTTAKFNLNLLRRINNELGGDFDLSRFQHMSNYNVFLGAMESSLLSLKAQVVNIAHLNNKFSFKAYEPIHLEYSYKFLPEDTRALATATGYEVLASYYDSRKYFIDTVWKVKKQ